MFDTIAKSKLSLVACQGGGGGLGAIETKGMGGSYKQKLMEMYQALLAHFGPQKWWPADSPFEVMVGAVLTQNTNWANVERAIRNLKDSGVLDIEKLSQMETKTLACLIRPAGYYNIKATRLKNFIEFLVKRYGGDLDLLFSEDTERLQEALLSVKGIGKETADSILLYAAKRPVFVIDAYTYRILFRHGLVEEHVSYEEMQALFLENLDHDEALFNEFHALIVQAGKTYCRPKPRCGQCPLRHWESEMGLFTTT